MYYASREYKNEMRQDLRDESYVYVYLGVVDNNAQESMRISSAMADFASNDVNDAPDFEAYYATAEENFARVDGSMFFLPEDTTQYALYQGAVSADVMGALRFVFKGFNHINLRGLTVDFGEVYPTEFKVTNGKTTRTYTNDTAGEWVTDDTFDDCHYIEIQPISMLGGQQRLRVFSILFGVGLQFTNKQLIKTSRKNTIDHIMSKLPTKKFDFTIDNTSKKFCQDNPKSYSPYLQQGQVCEFYYGRMLPSGKIYKIPGGKTVLKSWSSNDTQAKFTTVGNFDYMTDTYNKGKYYPNGRSVYDLCVDVLTDAGIEQYNLDPYLKKLYVKNPLPVGTHKSCLQLLANFARCVMYEDRNGVITVHNSFLPEVEALTATNATEYSDINSLLTEDEQIEYADAEYDYANENQYFLPENGEEYMKVGYVSGEMAHRMSGTALPFALGTVPLTLDHYDGFNNNPTVTVKFEADASLFGMMLEFGDAIPIALNVKGYYNGELKYTDKYTDVGQEASLPIEFYNVDTIVIEFTEAVAGQRIHLKKINFGEISDYKIYYHDLKTSPTATATDKISNLLITVTSYGNSTEEEKKTLSTVSVSADTETTVTFSSPSYDFSLNYKEDEENPAPSGDLEIIESGAYYAKFKSSIAYEVEVKGYEYAKTESIYTKVLNETGKEKTSKNPLISDMAMAEVQGEWLAEYFNNDTSYSLTYRGEPRIDADDLIYLENKNVEKNLIRIDTEQLDTAQGMSMSCKLKARRVSYVLEE